MTSTTTSPGPGTDPLNNPDARAALGGRTLVLIVAAAENNVIGRDGDLPWSLPDDMRFFMERTKGNPVIMGRRTFASLPKPLAGRTNIIVTRSGGHTAAGSPDVRIASDFTEALRLAVEAPSRTGEIFAAGGSAIYAAAEPLAGRIDLTRVHASPDGDTHFPIHLPNTRWRLVQGRSGIVDERHAIAHTFEYWAPASAGAEADRR